ncbi:hypothetical protein D9613_001193 [Agrocybe pediades]|uniref:F-box domain-containing protein n=1 Tax=Agrocybe pediades TaxID=84607 RepID=A0A8H4R2F8_9AGAR|nr:hypothetical protein D9613_001193 [Agrocybe pediades]
MTSTPKKLPNLGVSPTSMFRLLKDQPTRFFRSLYLDEPRSPVPHLLTSNALPTSEEISLITDALSSARAQHANLARKLESQTTTSHTGSSRIEQQIQAVNRFIAVHEARILPSPILQLPVELLQIIFRMVTDALVNDRQSDREYNWTWGKVDLAHLPFTISHVCRQWRNVVLSMPDLWSVLPKVELDRSSTGRLRRRRTLQIASKLLHRSVGSTITASINGGPGFTPSHPAMKLLVAHCGRWSKLDVILDSKWKVLDELESMIAGRLSSLHTLILEFISYWPYPSDAQRTIDLFRDVPFLKHVTLKEPPFYFSFPKGQIQTLVLHLSGRNTNPVKGQLGIVRSSSVSLTSLELKISIMSAGGYLCETSLNLPNLISLKIRACVEGRSGWLVDHILVPSLQKLDLNSSAADEDLCVMAHDMLSRSGCSTIYDLCIQQHERQPRKGSVIKLLEIEPFLRRLCVTIPQAYDLIALSNSVDPPAPFLEHCIFSIGQVASIDLNTLIEPIKSIARNRCPPNPRFKPSPILRRVGQHPRDGEVQPLFLIKTYKLIVYSRERATQMQFLLEGFPSYGSCFPAFNLLNHAKHVLGGCLYGVGWRYITSPRSLIKYTPQKEDFEGMDRILNEVLSTKINHVAEILVTELHRVLAYITKRFNERRYLLEYGPLIRLATLILQSWVPIFEKYTPAWHCTTDTPSDSPALIYAKEKRVIKTRKSLERNGVTLQ